MANSKYAYVKSYETEDKIMMPNIIVVRVDGRDFRRFSEVHEFEKPNDTKALDLMNMCAKDILEKFPDVIFSYGCSDEYSFIFKRETKLYKRRASKILSLITSRFASAYVTKWKALFPQKDLKYAPSFWSRVICCPTVENLQAYLLWRQNECHLNNDIPENFRHGTCTLPKDVEDIVKYKDDGCPVKRLRREIIMVHSENIASKRFWNAQVIPMKQLGQFTEDIDEIRPELVKYFQYESKLFPSTWVVIRIDGFHFHSFTKDHEFEKPNDAKALNLMNSCAAAVLEEFKDIVFAYGDSDEYSFVLKKDSQLYQRHASEIISAVVSFFSSTYTMKWNEFFPHKEMKYPPYFDGRAICYPSRKILLDYLAWRQADCHINNQYNTCFWMLVKSGKSNSDAKNYLERSQAQKKSDLMDQLSGIINYYSGLPPMFRLGSSVYWDKETKMVENEEGAAGKSRKIVVVRHCNIIERDFWEAHPEILNDNLGEMANKKCEYVESFEMEDEIMLPNIIAVLVDGHDFRRFSEVHEFEKPNDKKALDLMKECGKAILEQFPDVIFSYGYGDEYSFILKKENKFYQHHRSQIHSLIGSRFTFHFVTKWKALFPQKDLKYAPSFRSRAICCASVEILQAYLFWRQNECHLNNQYDTCFWELIKSGKTEEEAKERLKVSLKQDKNELLYQNFNINYKNDVPEIFRQGTCTLKTEVEEIVKYKDDSCPGKTLRREVIMVRSQNIASKRFWNAQVIPMKELGQFTKDLHRIRPEYVKSFQNESKLLRSTWIVIRVDASQFHRFTEFHEFEKPNDAEDLNLMNLCAAAVFEGFKDIVFAYGVSDEYSFVLEKDSELFQRSPSDIVSVVTSLFTSTYILKWDKFFPHKEMKPLPNFYGRVFCYPSREILLRELVHERVDEPVYKAAKEEGGFWDVFQAMVTVEGTHL